MDLDSGGTYRPKTRETQAAYETLLSMVQDKLGDYATDVIAGAADEVLGILKSSHLKASTSSPKFLTNSPVHDEGAYGHSEEGKHSINSATV